MVFEFNSRQPKLKDKDPAADDGAPPPTGEDWARFRDNMRRMEK